jgi:hypothetical protein
MSVNAHDTYGTDEFRPGKRKIFRAWKLDKDGNKIWARQFGKRGFPIWINDPDPRAVDD